MLLQNEQERGADHERGMATKRWSEDSLRRASLQISCLVQALFLVPGAKYKGDARNGRREIVSPLAARSQDDLPRNIGTSSTLGQSLQRGFCGDEGVSVCSVEK